MRKEIIVSLIIIIAVIIMAFDIKYSGISVFENIFSELETESMRELKVNISYPDIYGNPFVEKKVNDRQIILSEDIKRLFMNNEMGSINITGEKRDDISLSFILTVYAAEEELAEMFIKELDIIDYIREENIIIELGRPELIKGIEGVRVDYTLAVPEDLLLDIKNNFGRLTVVNMSGDLALKSSNNEMDIRDISGKVDLSVAHGDLFAENIKGALKIDSAFTNVICSGVSGDFYVNTAYGQLSIHNFHNNLQIDGKYSIIDVELSDNLFEYRVLCEAKYGKIKTNLPIVVEKKDNVQEMKGSEGSGSVIEINVINKYGDINIYK